MYNQAQIADRVHQFLYPNSRVRFFAYGSSKEAEVERISSSPPKIQRQAKCLPLDFFPPGMRIHR
jgi:hypothetical protein